MVIAGAGSGKTTVMAARVVCLVATGQVPPDQVLGLTFTTKAAARAGAADPRRARRRRLAARAAPAQRRRRRGRPRADSSRPTTPTPPSLLTEHGLRIGPRARHPGDRRRRRATSSRARVIERHTGRVDQLSDSPTHVIDYLLALDGALARAPRRARRPAPPSTRDERAAVRGRRWPTPPASRSSQGARARSPRRAPRRSALVEDYRAAQGGARAHGLLRPDRARRAAGRRAPGGRRGRAGQVPGRAARRVPGHLRRPGAAAAQLAASAGRATRSPRSATPTRRSTAGAAPRCPTSCSFGDDFPAADGAGRAATR